MKQIILFSSFAVILFSGTCLADLNLPLAIEKPYTQVVPILFDQAKEIVLKKNTDEDLDQIGIWEENLRNRIPEFLQDLIEISKSLEQNSTSEDITRKYSEFINKWQPIISDFPGFAKVKPGVDDLFNQLLSQLPHIIDYSGEPYPFFTMRVLYGEFVRVNPWGLGSFWSIPALPNSLKNKLIYEKTIEEVLGGIKKVFTVKRECTLTKDGLITAYELIEDNKKVSSFKIPKDPTLIHEILRLALENNEKVEIIEGLKYVVKIIDQEMLSALENGQLDQVVYNYFYHPA